MKNPTFSRQEDHTIHATLRSKNFEIRDVLCRIYLPKRKEEKPLIVLEPNREVLARIRHVLHVELEAIVYGFNNKVELTISCPKIYITDSSTRFWGPKYSESIIMAEPQHLNICRYIDDPTPKKTTIIFWISPNKNLTPFTNVTMKYTGEVKYHGDSQLKFLFSKRRNLIFTKHFSYEQNEDNDLIQWFTLAASINSQLSPVDVEQIRHTTLEELDDFLLLASFATRHRTSCVGWVAYNNECHTEYFRGDYAFPDFKNKVDTDDTLIKRKDIVRFLNDSFKIFLNINNKRSFRSAVFSLVPLERDIIERSFVHKFSALETLLLDFRKTENLQFVLPKDNWRILKSHLKESVVNFESPKLSSNVRSSFYQKLDEINRISLKEAFESFCTNHSIYLNDLWPVFGQKGQPGLVQIRNKLVHGEPCPTELFDALIIAEQHLHYVIERVILALLKWKGETNVNPFSLQKNYADIIDLDLTQNRFCAYVD